MLKIHEGACDIKANMYRFIDALQYLQYTYSFLMERGVNFANILT